LMPLGLTSVAGLEFVHLNQAEAEQLYHEIFIGRVYARHGVRVRPDTVVFDLGANVGLFGIWALGEADGVTLVAAEPAPAATRVLAANLQGVERRSDVTVHQVAVGKPDAGLAMMQPGASAGAGAGAGAGAAGNAAAVNGNRTGAATITKLTYYPDCPAESTRHPRERQRQRIRLREAAAVDANTEGSAAAKPAAKTVSGRPVGCSVDAATRAALREFLRESGSPADADDAPTGGGEVVECRLVSVSDLIRETERVAPSLAPVRVGLLKVDVEGDELDVLLGLAAGLQQIRCKQPDNDLVIPRAGWDATVPRA